MGRSLIDTASYDPDTLKMLSPAFDDVWREMVGKYLLTIGSPRSFFGLADGGERDLARMKTCAMKLMAHAQNPALPKQEGAAGSGARWLGAPGVRAPRWPLDCLSLAPPCGGSPFLCSAMPRNDRMMAVEVASNAPGGFAFLEPSVTSCRIC